jgi:hypothetical protein
MHPVSNERSLLRALVQVGLCTALSMTGCAAGIQVVTTDLPPIDPLAAPPYGMAQVCVLRPHTWALLHTIPVEDNGQVVGATRGPSFFCYLAHPGAHRIVLADEKSPALDIQLAAGQRAYLHLRVRIHRSTLHPITDEADLLRLLGKCEYSTLVDWPGHELASEAYAQPKPAGPR